MFIEDLPDETSFGGHSSYSGRQIKVLRDVSSYPLGVSKRAECEPESETGYSSLFLMLKSVKSSCGLIYTVQDTIVMPNHILLLRNFIAEWAFFQL